jgi:hypothetical protein
MQLLGWRLAGVALVLHSTGECVLHVTDESASANVGQVWADVFALGGFEAASTYGSLSCVGLVDELMGWVTCSRGCNSGLVQ